MWYVLLNHSVFLTKECHLGYIVSMETMLEDLNHACRIIYLSFAL